MFPNNPSRIKRESMRDEGPGLVSVSPAPVSEQGLSLCLAHSTCTCHSLLTASLAHSSCTHHSLLTLPAWPTLHVPATVSRLCQPGPLLMYPPQSPDSASLAQYSCTRHGVLTLPAFYSLPTSLFTFQWAQNSHLPLNPCF